MKPTYKPTRGVPEMPPKLPALPRAKQQKTPLLTQAIASRINAKASQALKGCK